MTAPTSAEAVFNRAIALEKLFLDEEARRAWRDYLRLDGDSAWADEARLRLGRLIAAARPQADPRHLLLAAIAEGNNDAIAQVVAVAPQEAREVFEEDLLPKWAESIAREDREKADRRLRGAQQIADLLAQRGNRIYQKITAEMMRITDSPPDLQAASMFVQSLRRFRNGQDALSERRFSYRGALLDLNAAERGLLSIESAALPLVQLRQAICRLRVADISGARTLLGRLGDDHLAAEAPSLEARRHHILGVIAQRLDAPTDALASYRRALTLYSSTGEHSNVASVNNSMAESLDSLGQSREAWKYRYQVLSWSRVSHPAQQSMELDALDGTVFAALVQRCPQVALHFQNRVVKVAESSEGPPEIVWALLRRARIEVALGRGEEGQRDFDHALQVLRPLRSTFRGQIAATIDILRREIEESENRTSAIAAESLLSGLLGAPADFDVRRGDPEAARSQLERAIGELEQRRARIAPGDARISFLDQARPLYERLVALQLNLGHAEEVLEVLERFRARVLLEDLARVSDRDGSALTGRSSAAPLEWRELCRRVPADTVIVVYAEVNGRLVSWLVRPDGIEVSWDQPAWSSVSSRVQRFDELRSGDVEAREVLANLHQDLVAPWKDDMGPGTRIIFVPTGFLHRVPFAALLNPDSGRFLIQDHAIGVAASASQFIVAAERDLRLASRPLDHVLLVGATAGREKASASVPSLPGAALEIEQLGRIYRDLDLRSLTGAHATPTEVMASLGRSEVVHFAGHAVPDLEDSTRSRLLLSLAPSGIGDLSVQDILRLRLTRTRLVVLAACQTHLGPVSASEGSLSLASSFLAAGVPAFIGSIRPVGDESTARLFVRLHQELRRGVDPMAALRTVQLEELTRVPARSGWTWASFQLFGGVVARHPAIAAQMAGG